MGEDINKVLARYMTKNKDFDIPVSSGSGTTPVDVYLDTVTSGRVQGGVAPPVFTPDQVLTSLAAETVKGTNGSLYRLDQLGTIPKSDAASSIQERDGEPIDRYRGYERHRADR